MYWLDYLTEVRLHYQHVNKQTLVLVIAYLSLTNIWHAWKSNIIDSFMLYQNTISVLFKCFIVCVLEVYICSLYSKDYFSQIFFSFPFSNWAVIAHVTKNSLPHFKLFLQNVILFLFNLSQVEILSRIYISLQNSMADSCAKFTLFNSHRNLYFTSCWCLQVSSCIK